MGEHCSLNPFAVLYGMGGITLGNGVRIATQTVIVSANHNYKSRDPLRLSGTSGLGVEVGNDVWIGAGARILDGVSIGSDSAVGAGAVVNRSVPTGHLAIGVPAESSPIRRE